MGADFFFCSGGHLFTSVDEEDCYYYGGETLDETVLRADRQGCPCGSRSYVVRHEGLDDEGEYWYFPQSLGTEEFRWLERVPDAVDRNGRRIAAFIHREEILTKYDVSGVVFPLPIRG